jgi:hypothetical protein
MVHAPCSPHVLRCVGNEIVATMAPVQACAEVGLGPCRSCDKRSAHSERFFEEVRCYKAALDLLWILGLL